MRNRSVEDGLVQLSFFGRTLRSEMFFGLHGYDRLKGFSVSESQTILDSFEGNGLALSPLGVKSFRLVAGRLDGVLWTDYLCLRVPF